MDRTQVCETRPIKGPYQDTRFTVDIKALRGSDKLTLKIGGSDKYRVVTNFPHRVEGMVIINSIVRIRTIDKRVRGI